MYNNDTPPSTLRRLCEVPDESLHRYKSGVPNLWFSKPSPGSGLEVLHENAPLLSLRIVKLSLCGRGCIPFHRHKAKEKFYYVLRQDKPFTAYLGIIDPTTGHMSVETLFPECTFVIPKNHWHMIWNTSDESIYDFLLVTSSSQDGSDIEWSPDGSILVRLSERAAMSCSDETPLQQPFSELVTRIESALEDD